MSVEEVDTVDAIGVEIESGKVVLTIADSLSWKDEARHELALQAKLNTYLSFIESGEILTSYPNAIGRQSVIDVVMRVEPSPRGRRFLSRVREVIEGVGIEFRTRVRPDS